MFKNTCWVNWLYSIMIAVLALISISSTISGCGNKGDLYLPKDASSAQTTSNTNLLKKN